LGTIRDCTKKRRMSLGKNARIIIVDDDENIRKTMKTILEDEGYVVDLVGYWQ